MRYAVYSEKTHELLGSIDEEDLPHQLCDGDWVRLPVDQFLYDKPIGPADIASVRDLSETRVELRAIAMRKSDGRYSSRVTSFMLFTMAEPEMLAKVQEFRRI